MLYVYHCFEALLAVHSVNKHAILIVTLLSIFMLSLLTLLHSFGIYSILTNKVIRGRDIFLTVEFYIVSQMFIGSFEEAVEDFQEALKHQDNFESAKMGLEASMQELTKVDKA